MDTFNIQKELHLTPCCICYENITNNDNFSNWNCSSLHADNICNKCTDTLINNYSNCPLCRAELKYNSIINNINIQIIDISNYIDIYNYINYG